ncbi:MAG: glycoside hydrolase family 108 protein [Gammaproteobacteria bacterium]
MTPFQTALFFVLREEGGYVDNPADHGGPTNQGITQATYDSYRRSTGKSAETVALIAPPEVLDIYSEMYWLPAHCQALPLTLAVCHFDWTVNHGVTGAIRTLQQVLSVEEDGVFGPMTAAALQSAGAQDLPALIESYLELRRQWYQNFVSRDPSQDQFLEGWLSRVNRLTDYLATLSN